MLEDATILCVYKTGGKVYIPEYVKRLCEGIRANSDDPKIVCLTDDEDSVSDLGIQTFKLQNNWPGWWSKLELFSITPNMRFVYFDLDTIIHGDIRPLLRFGQNSEEKYFLTLRDFNKNVPHRMQSSVMAWRGCYDLKRSLYDTFDESYIEEYSSMKVPDRLGDQSWIQNHLPDYYTKYFLQDVFEDMVSSKKWDTIQYRRKTPIVCYHGKPRPHEKNWTI